MMLDNQKKVKGRSSFKCNACTNNIMTISQDDPEVIIGNDKFVIKAIPAVSQVAVLKQQQTD